MLLSQTGRAFSPFSLSCNEIIACALQSSSMLWLIVCVCLCLFPIITAVVIEMMDAIISAHRDSPSRWSYKQHWNYTSLFWNKLCGCALCFRGNSNQLWDVADPIYTPTVSLGSHFQSSPSQLPAPGCEINGGQCVSLFHTSPALLSISVSISLPTTTPPPPPLSLTLMFMVSKTMSDWIGHYLISPLRPGIRLLFVSACVWDCVCVCVCVSLRHVPFNNSGGFCYCSSWYSREWERERERRRRWWW